MSGCGGAIGSEVLIRLLILHLPGCPPSLPSVFALRPCHDKSLGLCNSSEHMSQCLILIHSPLPTPSPSMWHLSQLSVQIARMSELNAALYADPSAIVYMLYTNYG